MLPEEAPGRPRNRQLRATPQVCARCSRRGGSASVRGDDRIGQPSPQPAHGIDCRNAWWDQRLVEDARYCRRGPDAFGGATQREATQSACIAALLDDSQCWQIARRRRRRTRRDPADRRRQGLRAGEPALVEEALRLLRSDCWAQRPVRLGGPTPPDVFLVTPYALIVIEGKRKEPRSRL